MIYCLRNTVGCIVLLCLAFSPALNAQSVRLLGLMPEINLRTNISDKINLRTGIESREILSVRSQGESTGYHHDLVDLTALLFFKTAANSTVSGGYTLRIRDGTIRHRTIQQFTIVSYGEGFRIGHRVATDQTFGNNIPTLLRLRYRATGEIPLNGTRIDPGEFYTKISAEALWLTTKDISELELRFSPVLGFEINKNQGFELGLDYRLKGVTLSGNIHEYWVSLVYFAPLNFGGKGNGGG